MADLLPQVADLIDRAIQEDVGLGDATTDALIPGDLLATAVLFTKSPGVLCGGRVALDVFRRIDSSLETELLRLDGVELASGVVIARVRGAAASLLRAERTALNFLQHLSGIATQTARYVDAVKGTRARIIDTRKTIPGLRALEKEAVRAGGGRNHRQNLGVGVLVKDNHIAALRGREVGIAEIVRMARERASHTIRVEIEVTTMAEAEEALDAGAELLLLDNMAPEEMGRVVAMNRGRAVLEASGGIDLATVRAVAECGVDLISVGALTHSAPALDISMDLEYER